MLQRRDNPAFWQSVTGSIDAGKRLAAAQREVSEKNRVFDAKAAGLTLTYC